MPRSTYVPTLIVAHAAASVAAAMMNTSASLFAFIRHLTRCHCESGARVQRVFPRQSSRAVRDIVGKVRIVRTIPQVAGRSTLELRSTAIAPTRAHLRCIRGRPIASLASDVRSTSIPNTLDLSGSAAGDRDREVRRLCDQPTSTHLGAIGATPRRCAAHDCANDRRPSSTWCRHLALTALEARSVPGRASPTGVKSRSGVSHDVESSAAAGCFYTGVVAMLTPNPAREWLRGHFSHRVAR